MVNFSDIKPFIPDGDWWVDVTFENLEMELSSWESRYGIDLNPDFQRGHVWTEYQQILYIENMLRGMKHGRDIFFNSPAFGLRPNEKRDLDDTILCVDGLQRLTAIKRFMNNEIKIFGNYLKDYSDRPRDRFAKLRIYINSLGTRAEVLDWYLQMNSGGTVHSESELKRVRELLYNELDNCRS